MKVKDSHEVLAGLLNLGSKRVLDMGCDTGGLVRLLTRLGARVWGLECNAGQLEMAQAAGVAGGRDVSQGCDREPALSIRGHGHRLLLQ